MYGKKKAKKKKKNFQLNSEIINEENKTNYFAKSAINKV